jgi:hypothetical protein
MRVPSGRAATTALLVAALAALLVAGRLLTPAPSAASLPDLLGQRVAQATAALRRLGLEGRQMNLACVALDRGNPADAVVVAQDPDPGSRPLAAVRSPCAPGPTCNPTTPPVGCGWDPARTPRPT